jgi:RES domain-containing protein
MKLFRLAGRVFHRYLTPKCAYTPLSGAGAATKDCRFNQPGVEALYHSRTLLTVQKEYRHSAKITPPATLAAYLVTLDNVADFSAGFDPALWPPEWAQWDCNWRKINWIAG